MTPADKSALTVSLTAVVLALLLLFLTSCATYTPDQIAPDGKVYPNIYWDRIPGFNHTQDRGWYNERNWCAIYS